MSNATDCSDCDGFGTLMVQVSSPTWWDDGYDTRTCTRCDGTGKVDVRHDTVPCASPDLRDTWPAPPPADSEVA